MAGVQLMLVGMGAVFLFLVVLVSATVVMSAVARRWIGAGGEPNADELAAIAAAVHRYRERGYARAGRR